MRIINIKSREQLNDFAAKEKNSRFPQSWQWGEFRQKAGAEVIRLGAMKDGKLIGAATLEKNYLGLGWSYFYCPRGPITNFQFPIFLPEADPARADNSHTISNELILKYQEVLLFLFKEIGKISKKENVIFLRFEPETQFPISNFSAQGRSATGGQFPILKTIDIQPAKTIILDLSKTDEELLAAMHPKTRYNIRLAERKGVRVRIANSSNFTPDFEKFWQIMAETGKRDKFRLHPKEHYRRLLQTDNDFVKLVLAEYRGKIIAGNIMVFFSGTATYVHGSSGAEHRNVMAPHALQWQAIKMAREKGCKYYDFYGVDKDKWPGVTRFKEGFGGQEIILPGTYDLIFNSNLYKLYGFLRSIRRSAF